MKPASILQVARLGFYLNAAVWLGFGLYTLRRTSVGPGVSLPAVILIAGLMGANALAMAWMGAGLGRSPRRYFLPALALLGANILLTFTDEFGFLDLVTLLLDLAIVGLLLAARSRERPAG